MSNESKTCPYCLESLNAIARRCPHCRMWVSKKSAAFWACLPLVYIAFVAMVIIYPVYVLTHRGASGLIFYEYSHLVTISDLKWHCASDENGYKGSRVFVTGLVHNKSDRTWDHCRIEVVMKNAKGNIIDVIQDEHNATIVPRNGEAMFRVQDLSGRSQDEYSSAIARVLWADEHTPPWF